jgi:hypothetical protein
MPSLSIVHALPSRRKKLATALSSPPKAVRTVKQPSRKPFEADWDL